jgi:hypothetical protein
MNLKILNSREKKRIAVDLEMEYGVDKKVFDGCDILQSSHEIWMTTRKCLEQNLEGLTIDSIGLQIIRKGKPTIHAVQLLFRTAEKEELTENDAKKFINGETIPGKRTITSYKGHPIDLAECDMGGIKRR